MIDNASPVSRLGTDANIEGNADAMSGRADVGVGLAQVRAALGTAAELLPLLSAILWQANGSELRELLGELDRVAALTGAGRVAVTAEAVQRGEVASSQCASLTAWVRQHAPSLASGGSAGQLAKCVEAIRKPRLEPVKEAVLSGDLAVPVALAVVSEFDKLRGRVIPEAEGLVLNGLVRIGIEDGAREVRKLRSRLLAEHGAQDEFQDAQDRAAREVALSHPVQVDDGVWEYLLRLDAEAKAVLEEAIGPLSAPWHPAGARDPRSAQQRRAQALIEVCRRVTAAAKTAGPFGGYGGRGNPASGSPASRDHGSGSPASDSSASDSSASGSQSGYSTGAGGRDPIPMDKERAEPGDGDWQGVGPVGTEVADTDADAFDPGMMQAALAGMGAGGAKASLVLTMHLTDLQERIGAAAVLGTTEDATLLAPETVRRIACSAGIIPVVLGSDSELLDLGRTERLFSAAQARAVLPRDRHCSFQECDVPAFWTQLHHVRHWVDGGPSDLVNAALLCARHHTIVHRDRLTASVTPTRVTWDTVPGSYDRALAREHRDHPAA